MEIPVPSAGYFLDALLFRKVPRTAKTPQVFAILLGCPPELGDKTLLLETLYTLFARYRKSKLELNWKLSSS